MSRIKRGWGLTKKSWALLNAHRELIRFPLYGALLTIAAGNPLRRPGAVSARSEELRRRDPAAGRGRLRAQRGRYVLQPSASPPPPTRSSRASEATVADGLAVARSRFPQICGWAALSTSIGLLIGVAREPGRRARQHRRPPGRDGLVAGHLPGGAGAGDRGHRPVRDAEALRPRSSRSAWGQQITGNIAIGGAVGPLRHPARRPADRRRRPPLALVRPGRGSADPGRRGGHLRGDADLRRR